MSSGSGRDAEITKVIEDIETFTHFLVEKDFARWLDYWAEDGVLMPPGGDNVVGREEIGKFVRANFGGVQSMKLSHWEVEVEGDLAVAASNVTWLTDQGESGSLKQVMILRRTADRRWLRERVIYNTPGSS